MSRLPVRLRVTLAFALAMAALLAGLGAFVYLQLRSDLDETIDDSLRSRLDEVSSLLYNARPTAGGVAQFPSREDETFVQALTPTGEIAYSSPLVARAPLLSPAELESADDTPVEFERSSLERVEGGARLLAARVEGRALTVVVGASLDDRDETLASLLTLFLVGGPIALLLASLAGYWVAGTALRPVEAMRRRAAEISTGDPGERLPVPPAADEIGRLGRTLNEMLARLEAAIERERRFVDDASHELRTPLALHRAELELALRYGDDADALRRAISSAIEEVHRLVALAEALLVVARAGDGELALARAPVSVGELFATVVERFRGRFESARRRLIPDAGGHLVVVGDRLRLEQALTGLVDNALRHGAGDVRLCAERNGREVELHVSDDGEGFSAELIPHAFERFSRADAARGRGGTGLGLAIVETIAAAHGGSARVRNRPEGGADAWITVPAATVAA